MDSPSESGSTTSDTNTPVMQHQHGAKAPHNNNNKNNNNNNSEHGVVHMIDDDFVDRIHFPKDPDEDDVGFKAMFEAATNLQTVNWVRGAWRTTVYVSFPLFTLAVHPNTMFTFGIASMLVAAVVSTSCHRNTLGEQIGLHTWTWRGMTYMMVLGTIFDYWNIYGHVASWWGMIAAGIFVAGLPTDTNIRKFMYLYFFVYIMEGRMYYSFLHMVPHHNAALFAADCYMGTMFGVAASLFPYPVLLKTTLDMMMTRLFGGIGKMLVAMRTHVWSNNPHASVLFFNDRSPFERIELLSGLLGTLLWFVNWEPLEFPLRNPIRRLKLSFLRRIMALTYAAFDAGRTISHLRRDQAERVAMLRVRRSMLAKVPGLKMDDSVLQRQVLDAESDYCSDALLLSVEKESGTEEMMRMKREIDALRANTYEYVVHFTNVLGDAVAKVGSTNSTPECLVETIPLNDLAEADTHMRRNLRLEMVQAIGRQCEMVKRHKSGGANNNNSNKKEEGEDDHAGEDGLTADDLTALLEFQAVVDDAEVYIRLHMLFFHTLLSMIAGEIAAFGDQMKTYAPEKSLCARLLDHFIYEPWHDFWSELWCLLNLARPSDYRTVKDAIKMTCAYLSACAFNFELWMPKDMFLYTFGTTILLGLPVEEESLNMGINRTAGNVIGCALGYLVYHNTHTLAQIIATTMCFVFMCQCAKNHPLYGQTFFYASVITMGGVATSIMDTDLIIRVMASSYTVLSYMLCCMLIFPNNPIKIVFNYRLKLAKVMSELLDDVAITARLEVKYGMGKDISPMDPDGEDHLLTAESELDQMCSQLNVQLSLADKMLIMCDKWTPFAARDPVVRGMLPFPDGPSRYIHGAQQRIVASLQLLVFGMQLLHRPRFERPNPQVRSIMSGSLADFLEDFADISRAVFQDFINSIHLSRTWSYDHSLTLVSRLSRMRVHMYASLYQCYVLLGSPLVDSAPKLSTADVDRLITDVAAHRGGAGPAHPQQHPPASQQPRHSNPLLSGGDEDDTLMPEGSFADRVLQTRHDTNSIHPTPVNLHDSVAVSSTNNMRYLHQAKLRESAAPPKGSYPFGAESPELELAGDIKRDRREDEAELQRRQSHMHVEDGGHRTEFEPDAEPSRRNTQDGGAVSAGGGVLPRYRGPNFSYQEDAMDLPVDTDLVALISIFSSCGAIMSELENMTGPVKNCSDFQKQLHEESLAIKLIDRVSDKITSYRRGIYERYHFLDAPTDSKLYSQVDPFMQWRF